MINFLDKKQNLNFLPFLPREFLITRGSQSNFSITKLIEYNRTQSNDWNSTSRINWTIIKLIKILKALENSIIFDWHSIVFDYIRLILDYVQLVFDYIRWLFDYIWPLFLLLLNLLVRRFKQSDVFITVL